MLGVGEGGTVVVLSGNGTISSQFGRAGNGINGRSGAGCSVGVGVDAAGQLVGVGAMSVTLPRSYVVDAEVGAEVGFPVETSVEVVVARGSAALVVMSAIEVLL